MHKNTRFTFFIKKSQSDEARLIREIFLILKEKSDANKIKTDILLFTPTLGTVKCSAFISATSDEIGRILFKKKEVKLSNHRLILRTEQSPFLPSSIDMVLGLFATDKMLEKIEKSDFSHSLVLLSERASIDYWIKKLNPQDIIT